MKLHLEIWRQAGPHAEGHFESINVDDAEPQMSILELLQHIVNEPAPKLTPEGRYPLAEDFIDGCLLKDPDQRRTPKDLLVRPCHLCTGGSQC